MEKSPNSLVQHAQSSILGSKLTFSALSSLYMANVSTQLGRSLSFRDIHHFPDLFLLPSCCASASCLFFSQPWLTHSSNHPKMSSLLLSSFCLLLLSSLMHNWFYILPLLGLQSPLKAQITSQTFLPSCLTQCLAEISSADNKN